jgi:hypothetical protein
MKQDIYQISALLPVTFNEITKNILDFHLDQIFERLNCMPEKFCAELEMCANGKIFI